MLSISVIPGGWRGVKDLSLGCALTQSPSPKVPCEVSAEPLLKDRSLDSQDGALSTPAASQSSSHLMPPPQMQGLPPLQVDPLSFRTGWANISCKGLNTNYFGFVGHMVSAATT